eukprot:scpid50246/ scgid14122/ 
MRRNRDRRPCPWVTDELVACVRERDRLHRLLMKNRCNDDLRSQHRTARAKARKLDRSLKNTYFIQQCQTSDQRKLWSVINTVVGRKKNNRTLLKYPYRILASCLVTLSMIPSVLLSSVLPLVQWRKGHLPTSV